MESDIEYFDVPPVNLSPTKIKLLKLLGVVLTIIVVGFAHSGFSSWNANRHESKACNLLLSIGGRLTANSLYGDGINTLKPDEALKVVKALHEAEATDKSDGRRAYFNELVILFANNLHGDGIAKQETLHSPYELFRYGIEPMCRNYIYIGE